MLQEPKMKWIINEKKQINIKAVPIFLSKKEIQDNQHRGRGYKS